MSPLRSWPDWELLAVVTFRRRKSMWLDCYEELLARGNDAAVAFAERHGLAWVVASPKGMQ